MSDKYKPINCDFYDHFEIFSMRQSWLSLKLKDHPSYQAVKIKSLQTQEKSEFALLSDGAKIRLDQVLEIQEVPLQSIMGQLIHKLDYNLWANQRIKGIIKESKESVKLNRLFSHIINAQHIWNHRMMKKDYTFGIWESHPFETHSELIQTNHANSIQYLNTVGLDEFITYRDTQDQPGRSNPVQVTTHIVNHGTYHRGQIIHILQDLGEPTVATDYIDFVS